MAKKVKYLAQIVYRLEEKYSKQKAQSIISKALKRYDEIILENKDEPKEHYMHTRQRIYPAIAIFDAMLSEGIDRKETSDFLVEYYKWRSSKIAPLIKIAFKIPGLYKAVPKYFFNMTQKSFGPHMGFESKDKYLSKTEMSFNMIKCPYFEKCKQYNCLEIVRGFCDADDICYGNMHPKLTWDRTKTLGYGKDCCDFKIRIKE